MPAYIPPTPLEREIRKLVVQNYTMFYWVDETEKRITIARVIYSRRDLSKINLA
jgi:plasmid stabilization system protein ParE